METTHEAGAIAPTGSGASALFRQATDVAHVCKDIVLKCVVVIGERRYVRVEGWMAISVAHGCIASIQSVENVPGEGVKSVAEVRRISDQAVLATAEGFVGVDEPDWYGGEVTRINKRRRPPVEETMKVKKRPDHAIRAMAQTRAISRVLRAGFSHVVVLIDHKLSTIPAEEISATEGHGDDDDGGEERPGRPDNLQRNTGRADGAGQDKAPEGSGATPPPAESKKAPEVPRDEVIALREKYRGHKWEKVVFHFGTTSKGKSLGELTPKALNYWIAEYQPKGFGNKPPSEEDFNLRAALDVAAEETQDEGGKK